MALKRKAYDDIKKCIIDCSYRPGQMLNEQMLLSQFAVSRTPIRDAISRLEQEGFVTIVFKKGILVSPVDAKVINDVYDSRVILESYALENGFGKLNKAELGRILLQLKGGEDNKELDNSLHSLIVSTTTNSFIRSSYSTLQDWIARISSLSEPVGQKRRQETREEHLALVESCINNDLNMALKTLKRHLENARLHSLSEIEQVKN